MRLQSSGQSCISPNMMSPPRVVHYRVRPRRSPAAAFKLTACAAKANTACLECRCPLRLKAYIVAAAARGWESCGVRICGVKAALALGVLLCANHAAWAQLALVPQAKQARAERGPP